MVFNYYPFGLKHKGYNGNVSANVNSAASKFKYNGKEFEESLGLNWHDYGARNYDAALGRWMSIDPLADDYFDNSPYNYVGNSPIIAYDPDGMRISIVGDEDYRTQVLMQLFKLAFKSETGAKHLMDAIKSDRTLVIFDPNSELDHASIEDGGGENKYGEYETLGYDISKAGDPIKGGKGEDDLEANALTDFGHELAHFNSSQKRAGLLDEEGYNANISADEVYAVEEENKIRKELGMEQRTHYGGLNVYGKQIKQSSKYPGYFNMVSKKDYAKRSRGTVHRASAIKGSGFKISVGTFESFKRGGTYLSVRVKKPVPKKQTNITSN